MNKEQLLSKINEVAQELFEITKELYKNPEIGFQEYKSSKLLAHFLSKHGFEVTYPYVLDTGYLGVYDSKHEGPKIGFLCEYDALPGVGHGCGHNLICTMSIAGAYALRDVVDEIGGSIYVYGTPAEENFGGKVQMAKAHAFDDLDIAIMLHPSTKNGLGARSMAIIPLKFDFYGVSAHGCDPYNGASALDAAVATYQGINMLRQFTKQPSFIHGIIKDGGQAANVIPDHASLEYYFRSSTVEYAKHLAKRGEEIAKACAKMNNCKVKISEYEETYEDTKINYALARGLNEAFIECGITDIEKVDEMPRGSTDVGAVSKVVPTVQGNIKIAPESVNGHSVEMAKATISPEGYKALINGGLALALLANKYLISKEFQEEVWKEFDGE